MKKPDYCPEWFDLLKYEEYVPKFIRIDWLTNIKARLYIFRDLREGNESLDDIQKEIAELPNLLSYYKVNNSKEKIIEEEIISDSVIPLDFFNIAFYYAGCYTLSEQMRNQLNFIKEESDRIIEKGLNGHDLFNDLVEIDITGGDELDEKYFELLDGGKSFMHAFLINDLSYSDEMLVEAFKKHLAKIRLKQFQVENYKQISIAKLNRLCENMVLPFIDIYLWMLATGNFLTDREIANIIYPIRDNTPLDFDAVDRVTRTTKPTALKILNGGFYFAML